MTSTLTAQEKKKFDKEIEALKDILTSTLGFAKKNLMLFNGVTLINYTCYFLDIFARFRYNCEGLLNLMDSFHKDYRLKSCVNLLLRSICSDIITALYLMTFYDKNETDNISVKNELDLISSEYLRFARQSLEEDHELLERLNIKPLKTIHQKRDWLKNLAPELFDLKGNIKSREQIRATTKPEIKNGLKKSGTFLTENEKFQRIKEKGFGDYGFIFIAFKYYSQFQHFTLMSKKLIEHKPFQDTYWMALTINHMLMTSDIISQITKSPNHKFRNELNFIMNKIVKHFT